MSNDATTHFAWPPAGEHTSALSVSPATSLAAVAARLDRLFDEGEQRARARGEQFHALWNSMRRSTVGGKKIRPALVVVTHAQLGGRLAEAAVDVAAAFELIHTAFLLHDDVIDGDTLRRGQLNLSGEFAQTAQSDGVDATSARSWGEAAAILAGDLLLHAAQGLIARLEIAHDVRSDLLTVLDEALVVTAAGELDDVALTEGVKPPALDDILEMSRSKTAHYSFQAPLRAGGLLANAAPEVLEALDEFGRHAGAAFQLRDDLLGVFGESEVTGKSATTDLRRAAMTPLMWFALESHVREHVVDSLGESAQRSPTQPAAQLDDARGVIIESGAVARVEALISDHVASALNAAAHPSLPRELREHLAAIAHTAGNRSW